MEKAQQERLTDRLIPRSTAKKSLLWLTKYRVYDPASLSMSESSLSSSDEDEDEEEDSSPSSAWLAVSDSDELPPPPPLVLLPPLLPLLPLLLVSESLSGSDSELLRLSSKLVRSFLRRFPSFILIRFSATVIAPASGSVAVDPCAAVELSVSLSSDSSSITISARMRFTTRWITTSASSELLKKSASLNLFRRFPANRCDRRRSWRLDSYCACCALTSSVSGGNADAPAASSVIRMSIAASRSRILTKPLTFRMYS